MRFKLTSRMIFESSVFPIMTVVSSVFRYVIYSLYYGFAPQTPMQWTALAGVVFGGILPFLLTLFAGINTGQYFLPRFLILISTIAVVAITSEFLDYENALSGNFVIILISLIITALYFYKIRPTKLSEWIVIFLSNPYLYTFVSDVILTVMLSSGQTELAGQTFILR